MGNRSVAVVWESTKDYHDDIFAIAKSLGQQHHSNNFYYPGHDHIHTVTASPISFDFDLFKTQVTIFFSKRNVKYFFVE